MHLSVSELVTATQQRVSVFQSLTSLQIREFLIHSNIHAPKAGDVVVIDDFKLGTGKTNHRELVRQLSEQESKPAVAP